MEFKIEKAALPSRTVPRAGHRRSQEHDADPRQRPAAHRGQGQAARRCDRSQRHGHRRAPEQGRQRRRPHGRRQAPARHRQRSRATSSRSSAPTTTRPRSAPARSTTRSSACPTATSRRCPNHREVKFAKVERAMLRDMIAKTFFSISTDETRYHLNGVFFESRRQGGAHGLDRRPPPVARSSARSRTGPSCAQGIIIPNKGLLEIAARPRDRRRRGQARRSQTAHLFVRVRTTSRSRSSSSTRSSRRTSRSSRRSTRRSSIAPRAALLDALRRASAHVVGQTCGIKLAVDQGRRCTITSDNPDLGEAREELDVELRRRRRSPIGFNAKYFVELLGEMDGDEVTLALNGELDPGLVRPADGDELPRRRHADADLSASPRVRVRIHAARSASVPQPRRRSLHRAAARGSTCSSGDNGQGKTNLLEAIYLLGDAALVSRRHDRGAGALRRGAGAACGARVEKLETDAAATRSTLAPGHKHGARRRQGRARPRLLRRLQRRRCSRPRTCGCPRGRRRTAGASSTARCSTRTRPISARRRPTRRCCARATRCCATAGAASRRGPARGLRRAAGAGGGADRRRGGGRSSTSWRRACSAAFARSRRPGCAGDRATIRALDISRRRAFDARQAARERRKDLATRRDARPGRTATTSSSSSTGNAARLYASQGQLRAIMLALEDRGDRVLCARRTATRRSCCSTTFRRELDPTRNAYLFELLADPCPARLHHDHASRAMSCSPNDRLPIFNGRLLVKSRR